MLRKINSSEVRVEPRYRVRDAELVSATVRPKQGEPREIHGHVLDVSKGGVRLKVDAMLSMNEIVRLEMVSAEVDFELQSDARVCWIERDIRAGWVVGCALEKRIAESQIGDLAENGALERRTDMRRPISFAAEAKSELAPTFQPVEVLNLSAGGFCAKGETIDAKLNERLLLRIVDGQKSVAKLIQARVAWIHETDQCQKFGCTFLTKDGHAQLEAVFSEEPIGNPLFRMIRMRPATRWSFVAAVVVIILAYELVW